MEHDYSSHIIWTGNRGKGTEDYHAYDRTWDIAVAGKAVIHCSNDPLLGGDDTKMNPEDLFISSLSACHMLWYLHFAANAGIIVKRYEDTPHAIGEVLPSGAGRFLSVELRPSITLSQGSDKDMAFQLHDKIHQVCFIARSVNFPVSYAPDFHFA